MSLLELVLLLLIALVGLQFWRLRAVSEHARQYLQHYCDRYQLQLISVARSQSKLKGHRGKLDWYSSFIFEFSGNGEEKSQGTLRMIGTHIIEIDLPVYKVN